MEKYFLYDCINFNSSLGCNNKMSYWNRKEKKDINLKEKNLVFYEKRFYERYNLFIRSTSHVGQ